MNAVHIKGVVLVLSLAVAALCIQRGFELFALGAAGATNAGGAVGATNLWIQGAAPGVMFAAFGMFIVSNALSHRFEVSEERSAKIGALARKQRAMPVRRAEKTPSKISAAPVGGNGSGGSGPVASPSLPHPAIINQNTTHERTEIRAGQKLAEPKTRKPRVRTVLPEGVRVVTKLDTPGRPGVAAFMKKFAADKKGYVPYRVSTGKVVGEAAPYILPRERINIRTGVPSSTNSSRHV
jgi:hypothetical protein